MALDNCRPSELPESDILNNGRGEERYRGIPNENDVASSVSDSGNSIFLTQADTPAPPLRKVRTNRATSLSYTFSLSEGTADTESEESSGSFVLHSETDSQQHRNSCRDKKPHRRPKKRDIHFPFLEKYYGRGFLTWHQRQTLVNSSIGGFFKCMKSLSLTDKQRKKTELFPSPVSDFLSSEEETEVHEDQDNQDNIRIVDGALFIQNFHKRKRQEWGSNTKKVPSEVKNTKKKPPNAKDVSKAPVRAQSRGSKRSSPSEVKETRKGQNTKDVLKSPGCPGRDQTKMSKSVAVKNKSVQNMARYGSSCCSKEGNKMRGCDNSPVLERPQTKQSHKTPSRVTSRHLDVYGHRR
ncbi:phoenix [Alosa pseudoharengus]|uniref:phoenix n=1 Tax=Alosa pseudoharengus TaxID=34774 RepID=UPI003F889269